MDALSAAYDSDSSGGEGEREPVRETSKDEAVSINTEESSSILSRLKEKFPLNSAPSVPVRVSPVCVYWNMITSVVHPITCALHRNIRTTY